MRTISIQMLKEILQMEKVYFEYTKKDGSIRKAYGTRQYAFIPEVQQPKNESFDSKNLRYFDLDKNAWRSIGKDVEEVNVLEQK
jgi:hypothetical protein